MQNVHKAKNMTYYTVGGGGASIVSGLICLCPLDTTQTPASINHGEQVRRQKMRRDIIDHRGQSAHDGATQPADGG